MADFTIEDGRAVGKKFKAVCRANYDYEHNLTIGKEYEIEITERILPGSPLCKGVGDGDIPFECHLARFEKEDCNE